MPAAVKAITEAQVAEVNVIDLLPSHRSVSFATDLPQVHDVAVTEQVHDVAVGECLTEALMSLSGSTSKLSEDKILQAALDSACNRSCAGTTWIQRTVQALQLAPSYVRELIHRVPERERFRFGNGGQLTSEERVRLPFVIAGKIVLVWVSAVPCSSLGLLLGKDALDALGALLDFMGNRLQLQLLAPDKWIPLRKLKAGHFSIPCLPTPLTRWPSVSSSEWIVIGKGSCCEVQVGSKQKRLLKKLKKASAEASVPESQVTEHFLPEAFWSNIRTLGFTMLSGPPRWIGHGNRQPESRAAFRWSWSEVALAWNSSLADSAAIPEVFTTSLAVSDHSERMAGAGERHGGEVCMAERLAQADRHREPVHHLPPQGVRPPSRSDGSAVGLYGGRCEHLRPGGIEAATSEEVARSSGSRDNEIAAAESRREDAATSRLTRAKRRIAEAQGRAGQSSRIAEREGRPRSHSRSDQEAAAAHREGLDREAELGSARHPAIVIDSSSEAETQAHSSSNTTDS